MDPSGFIPRQAMPFDSELFKIIGADETLTNAKLEMELLPPFPPDSIIHDAACGLGPVTQSILATSPPDSIQIQASDSAPPMAGIYNQIAAAKGWPSRAVVMDAQNLSAVPDGAFSHVFLSFGQPIIDDPAAAAWEMHRTLRPGGTAGISDPCWSAAGSGTKTSSCTRSRRSCRSTIWTGSPPPSGRPSAGPRAGGRRRMRIGGTRPSPSTRSCCRGRAGSTSMATAGLPWRLLLRLLLFARLHDGDYVV